MHLLCNKGWSLRCSPRWDNHCFVAPYVGVRSEREQCCLLSSQLAFSHFHCYPQALDPSGADSWTCVHSRTLWVSPTTSPVRLGVSPATSTPTGFFSQRFWGFISPHWDPGLHGLSRSPVVPPGLSARECGTTRSSIRHLATSSLHPAAHLCPSYQSGWMFLL